MQMVFDILNEKMITTGSNAGKTTDGIVLRMTWKA